MENSDASSTLIEEKADELTERKKLKEDFISNVTLHGFRYLFTTGKLRRFFWWIFFLGAFIFAVILFKGVIGDYFEYKSYIVTNTLHKEDIGEVALPTLTFCFNKPYTKSRLNTLTDEDLLLLEKYISFATDEEIEDKISQKRKSKISKKSKDTIFKVNEDSNSKKAKDRISKIKEDGVPKKSRNKISKKSKDTISKVNDDSNSKKAKDKNSKIKEDKVPKKSRNKISKKSKDTISKVNEDSNSKKAKDRISKIKEDGVPKKSRDKISEKSKDTISKVNDDSNSKKAKDKNSKIKEDRVPKKSRNKISKKSKDTISKVNEDSNSKKAKDKISKIKKDRISKKSKDKKSKDNFKKIRNKKNKDNIKDNISKRSKVEKSKNKISKKNEDKISNVNEDKISKILSILKEEKNITSYEQLLSVFAISIKDQFKSKVSKAFSKRTCSIPKKRPCKARDFRMVLDKYNSPCIQYNFHTPEKPVTQASYDQRDGFDMFFDLDDANAIGQEGEVAGITLYINSRNRPHYKPFSIEVSLQPGTKTKVLIEELKTEKLLPPPYGKCGIQKFEVIKGYNYSRPMCKYDCKLKKMIKECGCVSFDLKDYTNDVPVCNIKQMAECFGKQETERAAHKASQRCRRSCIQECEQKKYPLLLETLKLGTKKQIALVKDRTGWDAIEAKEYIEENIIGVRVAYRNILERQEVATPAVSMETLLGTIGGSIGLGLGFSVLTLIEFLFFIFDFACTLCYGKRKQPPALPDENNVESSA